MRIRTPFDAVRSGRSGLQPLCGWARRVALSGLLLGASLSAGETKPGVATPALTFGAPTDAALQRTVETIDADLRTRFGMGEEMTAVGVFDLKTGRLAMVRPDKIFYAASVPKIAILLAWFERHPEAAMSLEPEARRELGLMIKSSDNPMAAKYSRLLGLDYIQDVLAAYGFYDAQHGGGLWMGKHYGQGEERRLDPVGGNSHGATVRQLLRFYWLLEHNRLVSPAASATMKSIFAAPELPHRDDKFVHGLAGRKREILRKAGWWENWFHDTAIVSGEGRRYILVALTHHAKGDDYLAELGRRVDDALVPTAQAEGKAP